MSTTLLQVEHIAKRFGGVQAVKDLSFTLKKGEILGLLGPNGAGKTTALNCISGALAPSAGQVLLEGRAVGGLAPHRLARLWRGALLCRCQQTARRRRAGSAERRRRG